MQFRFEGIARNTLCISWFSSSGDENNQGPLRAARPTPGRWRNRSEIELLNGNLRTKPQIEAAVVYKAIFGDILGYIPLHSRYIVLMSGRYFRFRYLKWPLITRITQWGPNESHLSLRMWKQHPENVSLGVPWCPLAQGKDQFMSFMSISELTDHVGHLHWWASTIVLSCKRAKKAHLTGRQFWLVFKPPKKYQIEELQCPILLC